MVLRSISIANGTSKKVTAVITITLTISTQKPLRTMVAALVLLWRDKLAKEEQKA